MSDDGKNAGNGWSGYGSFPGNRDQVTTRAAL